MGMNIIFFHETFTWNSIALRKPLGKMVINSFSLQIYFQFYRLQYNHTSLSPFCIATCKPVTCQDVEKVLKPRNCSCTAVKCSTEVQTTDLKVTTQL